MNYCRKLCVIMFAFAGMTFQSFTMKGNNDTIFYNIETTATFSGGEHTPFWLASNKHGLGTPEINNGYVRAMVGKPLQPEKKFSWGATGDITTGWHQPGVFRVQQLFAEMKYRALWISAGSKEWFSPYNNPRLSTGDLLFSGNALPIPQLRIGTYGFAPFWGCNGWFSMKAYAAYGFFTDSKWQKNWVMKNTKYATGVLYCSRGVWFKFGREDKFPLTGEFGVELGTQFGGKIHWGDGKVLRMPQKFIDWIKAFIPLEGGKDTPEDEQTNVQGNVNGEYTVAINYSINPDCKIKLYYEHYFEDHSQMFLEYGFWKDGLAGVEVTFPKNRFIDKFVYEYVATKDQTGSVLNNWTPEIPEQVSGQDGYFDHYLYGPWQTWGMTIGTPLALSPLYNKDHRLIIYNSRFIANHFGIEGSPADFLRWRMLLTFTQNWGTYFRPLSEKKNNMSGLAEIEFTPPRINGLIIKAALGWDSGNFLGKNFGGMLTIGFNGNFSIGGKK